MFIRAVAVLHEQAQQVLESAAQLMKSHGVVESVTTRIVVKASVSRGLRNLAAEINGTDTEKQQGTTSERALKFAMAGGLFNRLQA